MMVGRSRVKGTSRGGGAFHVMVYSECDRQRLRRTRTGTSAWAGVANAKHKRTPHRDPLMRNSTSAAGAPDAMPVAANRAAQTVNNRNARRATERVIATPPNYEENAGVSR